MPRLSDIYGRVYLFRVAVTFQIFVLIVLYLNKNLIVMTIVYFFLGFITTARISIAYVYMMEFIPMKRQAIVGTILWTIDGFTFLLMTLYFDYLGK